VDGQADKQSAEFLRTEATVREFATGTQNRFGQAQLLLGRVADPQRSALTPEQNARIHDNALQADREAAASVEQARDAKLQTMNAAGDTLASEILKAIAAGHNPDDVQAVSDAQDALTQAETDFQTADNAWRTAEQARDAKLAAVAAAQAALTMAIQVAIAGRKNPATDAGVSAARAALATAISDLETAEAAYRQSNHGILHAWEAAVPDTTWQLLADFEDAGQTLTVLQNADPAALVAVLDQAEAGYVAARIKADTSAGVLEQLDAARIQRAGYQQSAQQNNSLRLFSALRGDR
jgi:hypothetical protein